MFSFLLSNETIDEINFRTTSKQFLNKHLPYKPCSARYEDLLSFEVISNRYHFETEKEENKCQNDSLQIQLVQHLKTPTFALKNKL